MHSRDSANNVAESISGSLEHAAISVQFGKNTAVLENGSTLSEFYICLANQVDAMTTKPARDLRTHIAQQLNTASQGVDTAAASLNAVASGSSMSMLSDAVYHLYQVSDHLIGTSGTPESMSGAMTELAARNDKIDELLQALKVESIAAAALAAHITDNHIGPGKAKAHAELQAVGNEVATYAEATKMAIVIPPIMQS